MSADLFNADMPFNLAGESLNAELDAQAEANEKRVRELAAEEARKAQRTFFDGLIDQDCQRCGETFTSKTIDDYCPKCARNMNRTDMQTVRCPDHRNGGATRCPRGGADLQIWQRRQWGD